MLEFSVTTVLHYKRRRIMFAVTCLIPYKPSYLENMNQGTIARLTDRGFGFIVQEGVEKDLFFHSNELEGVSFNDLRQGDKVTFETADSPKGLNAVKVNRV